MVKRERDDSESSSTTSSSPTTIDPKLLAAQPSSTPDAESAKGSPAKKARGKRVPNLKSTPKTVSQQCSRLRGMLTGAVTIPCDIHRRLASRCFPRFPTPSVICRAPFTGLDGRGGSHPLWHAKHHHQDSSLAGSEEGREASPSHKLWSAVSRQGE